MSAVQTLLEIMKNVNAVIYAISPFHFSMNSEYTNKKDVEVEFTSNKIVVITETYWGGNRKTNVTKEEIPIKYPVLYVYHGWTTTNCCTREKIKIYYVPNAEERELLYEYSYDSCNGNQCPYCGLYKVEDTQDLDEDELSWVCSCTEEDIREIEKEREEVLKLIESSDKLIQL